MKEERKKTEQEARKRTAKGKGKTEKPVFSSSFPVPGLNSSATSFETTRPKTVNDAITRKINPVTLPLAVKEFLPPLLCRDALKQDRRNS